ncbi:uncharacterized protein LOC129573196 isoform X1 [Sitodiplosis mosellana]|uniref:uncharacterized protein LOC129573196 isoform X1 n=1 Tax=Sitodiplosis mosellana TaxID=263140 RepID=UPI002444DC26|nr:uncharacterized protein LOC129573196 isoform X1 [Sitodiplosis mosellana]
MKIITIFSRNKLFKCLIILLCILYFLMFGYLCLFVFREVTIETRTENPHHSTEISNLTQFLEQCFGTRVLSYTLKPLTKLGDSFGGVLHFVDIKLAAQNDSDQTPITRQISVKNPIVSLIREIHFYSYIIPAVEQFERMSNISQADRLNAFFRYYGSRTSLKSDTDHEDFNALLLLENVKLQNYVNGNKYVGFEKEETFAVLKVMAKFHALCIAMRLQQPELFNTAVRPYLPLLNATPHDQRLKILCDELRHVDNMSPKMFRRVVNTLKIGVKFIKSRNCGTDTPYKTIGNKDFWINNIMLKKDVNPIKVKIYDFQLSSYDSFALDLVFFLFTSIQNDVLKTNFKSFIAYYHTEFIHTMNTVDLPLHDYTYEKMWQEIRVKGKYRFYSMLQRAKISKADPTPINTTEHMAIYMKPARKAILDQWKFIIDMFFENGLI